jgi:hypothetical protein
MDQGYKVVEITHVQVHVVHVEQEEHLVSASKADIISECDSPSEIDKLSLHNHLNPCIISLVIACCLILSTSLFFKEYIFEMSIIWQTAIILS